MMDKKPKSFDGLEVTESDDGYAVYDPNNEKVHFLNATGILILELCNGKNTINDIIGLIAKTFNLTDMPVEEITSYIDNLYSEGLLE